MKDTEYLSISTRIRVMEGRLLSRDRRERMIEARSDDEALKLLTECGYTEPEDNSSAALDRVLAQAREELFRDLRSAVPQPALVEVFQLKYDYHNAKVLVKAQALDKKADRLLMSGGRYDPAWLAENFRRGELREVSDTFRNAVEAAARSLEDEADPQLAELILDKAWYQEMETAAKLSGSDFVKGYVRLSADAANLRTAVRCQRMGAGQELLTGALLPGGSVDTRAILTAKGSELAQRFGSTPLAKAAEEGAALTSVEAGSLTQFEKHCDDALNAYLAQARRIPFGEQPVVGYLCAREAEGAAIRTILSGRRAGLSGDAIRERLRDTYV